ncbi:MAG: hypothetical protein Q7T63_12635 [Burkholderiaceae bacterium]|nr:hypothetical protein [Burkholderiaceae bacterium]
MTPSKLAVEPVLVEDLSLTLRGANAASLVGLVGPNGCGKTSGLQAWARDVDRPVFWLSAEAAPGFDLLAALNSLSGTRNE